jgi:hypothetical protein
MYVMTRQYHLSSQQLVHSCYSTHYIHGTNEGIRNFSFLIEWPIHSSCSCWVIMRCTLLMHRVPPPLPKVSNQPVRDLVAERTWLPLMTNHDISRTDWSFINLYFSFRHTFASLILTVLLSSLFWTCDILIPSTQTHPSAYWLILAVHTYFNNGRRTRDPLPFSQAGWSVGECLYSWLDQITFRSILILRHSPFAHYWLAIK